MINLKSPKFTIVCHKIKKTRFDVLFENTSPLSELMVIYVMNKLNVQALEIPIYNVRNQETTEKIFQYVYVQKNSTLIVLKKNVKLYWIILLWKKCIPNQMMEWFWLEGVLVFLVDLVFSKFPFFYFYLFWIMDPPN